VTNVQPIPEGHHTITPHIVVDGASDAIAFYIKAFGAEEICRMPTPDGRLMHAEIKLGDSLVYLCDEFPEHGCEPRNPRALGGSSCTLHIYTADCDAAIQRALDAGATLRMPAADMFWGDRYGGVTCPWGHEWSFATHIADLTPEEIAAAADAIFGGSGD